jgi:hypothetical protein
LSEFNRERALPSSVRGPVERAALARFALNCFSESRFSFDAVTASSIAETPGREMLTVRRMRAGRIEGQDPRISSIDQKVKG